MNTTSLILSPVSGAIIGYFTNWLAIKMLFRPYKEIRLLGVKLPFTPGLIPKERKRLAEKVSEAISAHLLTKEALADGFTSEEATEKISGFIDKLINKLSDDGRSLGEYAASSVRTVEIIESVEKEISRFLFAWMQNEENQKKAAAFVTDKLLGDKKIKIPESLKGAFKEYINESLTAWTQSQGFEELLSDKAGELFNKLLSEERSLRDILSADWLISVKSMISGGAPQIAEFICQILENNPEMETVLKSTLGKVIDENLGRIASMFINKEKVYNNIKESLYTYLRDPDNQAELALKVTGALEKALDTQVMTYISKIPLSFKDKAVERVVYFLKYELNNGLYDKVWESIDNAKTINISSSLAGHIEGFVEGIIQKWVFYNGAAAASNIPAYIKESLFKIRISDYLNRLSEQKIKAGREAAVSLINAVIKKGAAYAAEAIDVAKLTKDQINALDLEQAEEIVLSVVKRELNAITYFGGILGFIIGMLPVVFELFAG